MSDLSANGLDDSLKLIGTVPIIIFVSIISSCIVLALGVGLALWFKCCGCHSRSRVSNGDTRVRKGPERNWYGRDGQDRSRWRSLAISEPDLGPNFASTMSDHRSWVELSALEHGVEGKMRWV